MLRCGGPQVTCNASGADVAPQWPVIGEETVENACNLYTCSRGGRIRGILGGLVGGGGGCGVGV